MLKTGGSFIPKEIAMKLFGKIKLFDDASRRTTLSTVARHAEEQQHSKVAVALLGRYEAYATLESIGGNGGSRADTSLLALDELVKKGQYSAVMRAVFSNSSQQVRLGGMALLKGHLDQGLLLQLDAAFESTNPQISAHMMGELLANGYHNLIVKILESMRKPGEVESFLNRVEVYAGTGKNCAISPERFAELKQIAADAKGKLGQ